MGNSKETCLEVILPKDTRDNFENNNVKDINVKDINPYLSHIRYSKVIKSEKIISQSLLTEKMKTEKIRDISFDSGKLILLSKEQNDRISTIMQNYKGHMSLSYKPYDKLTIGMEGSSSYHNIQLIRLHFLYGIPYIPASAIKGCLRNCFLTEGGVSAEEMQLLFGSGGDEEAHSGSFVFFDAFPERFSLGFDVQTPHYSNYYRGKEEPTDTENPAILYFTCLYHAEFPIQIACKNESIWNIWKDRLEVKLRILFTQYGIGSKRSIGYGVMGE